MADVGQHQMWVAKLFPYRRLNTHFSSGGLGAMGFAVPAAIGVHLARPDEPVWAISGDGGFQMNMQEMATMVQEGLPIKLAIFNNGYLGMVRQWQQFFHGRRYSATPIWSPDYVKLAEAYGIAGYRVEQGSQIAGAIDGGAPRSRAGAHRVRHRAGGQRVPDDPARCLALGGDRDGARAGAGVGMSEPPLHHRRPGRQAGDAERGRRASPPPQPSRTERDLRTACHRGTLEALCDDRGR